MSRAPRSPRYRWLLALAVCLPCVVLVVLGVGLIRQGAELAESRREAARARALDQVADDLAARLERIALDEAGAWSRAAADDTRLAAPLHEDVAIVGIVRAGRLVLPWDADPRAIRFGRLLWNSPWGRLVADAERQRTSRAYVTSEATLVEARAAAPDTATAAYTDLLRAHVMVQRLCECTADVHALYEHLLGLDEVDDNGMPIALYAANRLVAEREGLDRVLDSLARLLAQPWHAPVALDAVRDLLDQIDGVDLDGISARVDELGTTLDARSADTDAALALQRDFPGLALASSDDDRASRWRPVGPAPWLVGVTQAGADQVLVAIRAESTLRTIEAGHTDTNLRLSTSGGDGYPLGDAFPGISASFVDGTSDAFGDGWVAERNYYLAALGSVLFVTLVAGFVVWRNVQRELRLADLRTQFVSSVSHELRTPLTAIRMFAETMQMDRPLDPTTRAEYLTTIVNESERLTRLLNNVLDFSRMERGQRVYRLEPTPLAPVVREAAQAMQYPLAQLGFSLEVHVADDVPVVRIDRDAIEQAVLNLLSNAMKYSRDSRRIELSLAADGSDAVVAVRDHGVGIAPDEHSRIFERFYRVRLPENDRVPGTGLGLALVDHIVTGHGGRVVVDSTPGEGSTFSIRLPLEAT